VNHRPWDDWIPGVLNKRQVKELVRRRYIRNASNDPSDYDYSSLDLRISDQAYQLKACVKAFGRNFAGELLELNLAEPLQAAKDGSYLLERRKSYLFRLMEQIPELRDSPIYGSATAKSSVGRMDVLARLIVDGMDTYEGFEPKRIEGGDMYVEVTPMTFNVRVKPGTALTQLRLYKGPQKDSLIQGETLLATVYDNYESNTSASLSVNLSPDRVSGCDVSAFSAPLRRRDADAVIDLWKKPENQKPKPWEHWKFEVTDTKKRLRIVKDRFYIIRSREKIHLPQGIAVYCKASDETIGEMRIHYAGFVHPFFGAERNDGTRGTPLIFEIRGHDIDVSLMDGEKMARLEFYRMSEDARREKNRSGDPYASQSLKLSKFFAAWPRLATRAGDGAVTPK
jgi:dCTP deaminase